MKSETPLIYWDSCIFLSYVNDEPNRAETVQCLWEEIEKEKGKVVTSTVAIVEVAYASRERVNNELDSDVQKLIGDIWEDPTIALVELNQQIARLALQLIRDAIPNGWALKPKDAIHLASALWLDRNVAEVKGFYTYDTSLTKYQTFIGIHIQEPQVNQPKLL